MAERPSGTITFLATDIEQSTRRWEEKPDEMRLALARHDRLMAGAIEKHGGWLFKHTGDGFLAEFRSVVAATRCALEIQRTSESRNASLSSDRRLDFRIGIHLGDVVAEADRP